MKKVRSAATVMHRRRVRPRMPQTKPLELGAAAPPFKLPATDGRTYALDDFADARALAVVFWCNHCPYVQAYESRVLELARGLAPQGLALVLVNSNETEHYPEDSFEHMVERAREKAYPVPYLRDESQEVASAYGGQCTPHAFVFDASRQLVYHGAIDDNYRSVSKVKHHYLRDACVAAVAGRPPAQPFAHPIGCSIKWG